jgi:hypothetical protein
VLLNAMRSAAVRRSWGTGKLEARPEVALRRPLAAALHLAIRELAPRQPDEAAHVLGILKSFALKAEAPAGRPGAAGRGGLRDRWQPGHRGARGTGRADSGDIEIDLVELLTDVAGWPADVGRGIAVFVDEMQDLEPDDVSALCAACHQISQEGLPFVVVGAGAAAPAAVLSASKSYSERLFRYVRIDRLDRAGADRALRTPAQDEDADFTDGALAAMYEATAGYPYFVQAYGKVAWDVAPTAPITADDVRWPRRRPRPSWRSGSSGRGTSARRRPSGSTCGRWRTSASPGRGSPTPTPRACPRRRSRTAWAGGRSRCHRPATP